jgi:DNA-binding NarL/FixJ family response regulator
MSAAAPHPVGRVMLCDDAVAFSILFERWMEACGVEMVGQVETGADAVVRAAELLPDLIVIDHLLRDITSEGLAPQLREAAPNAKLLLISGMPDDQLAIASRAAGADAHISKAASAEAMCNAVRALLQQPV